ncbi:hypothetical protein DPMN_146074 [Dreissena polymorpha]|uniref:Uncharacterized protein n=1 Tax=Dreissena polymorpha TaxID=45954 RepID=A0A9D4F608_DREPO|nr:hypothetical protein DPMN_146074 [Dreissena polymorpha]
MGMPFCRNISRISIVSFGRASSRMPIGRLLTHRLLEGLLFKSNSRIVASPIGRASRRMSISRANSRIVVKSKCLFVKLVVSSHRLFEGLVVVVPTVPIGRARSLPILRVSRLVVASPIGRNSRRMPIKLVVAYCLLEVIVVVLPTGRSRSRMPIGRDTSRIDMPICRAISRRPIGRDSRILVVLHIGSSRLVLQLPICRATPIGRAMPTGSRATSRMPIGSSIVVPIRIGKARMPIVRTSMLIGRVCCLPIGRAILIGCSMPIGSDSGLVVVFLLVVLIICLLVWLCLLTIGIDSSRMPIGRAIRLACLLIGLVVVTNQYDEGWRTG